MKIFLGMEADTLEFNRSRIVRKQPFLFFVLFLLIATTAVSCVSESNDSESDSTPAETETASEDDNNDDPVAHAPNAPGAITCTASPIEQSASNSCTLTAAAVLDVDGDAVTYVDDSSTCANTSVSTDGQTITFTAPSIDQTCVVRVKAYDGSLYSNPVVSNVITGGPQPCLVYPSRLTSGTTTYVENFADGSSASFDLGSSCWSNYQSSFDFMQSSDISSTFGTETINSVSQNVLIQTVAYRAGMNTNSTVSYSPHSTPATGWDSGQWPYVIDLVKQPQCYSNVMVTVPSKPINPGSDGVIHGTVLNGTITGVGPTRSISGYFIHVNGGGNSVTLVKLSGAYDHAFDFFDHFPGSFGQPNPKTDGPYKGWNFKNSAWSAGGNPNMLNQKTLVAQYSYDSGTGNATISWEVRPVSGVDGSSSSWDQSVTLTGADALAPGGGFGVYTSFYGALGPTSTTSNGTAFGGVTLDCTNP